MFECRGSLLCACTVALLVSTAVAAPSPRVGTTRSVARNIKWQYQLSDEGVITKLPVGSLLHLALDCCAISVVPWTNTQLLILQPPIGNASLQVRCTTFVLQGLYCRCVDIVVAPSGLPMSLQLQERHVCADSYALVWCHCSGCATI